MENKTYRIIFKSSFKGMEAEITLEAFNHSQAINKAFAEFALPVNWYWSKTIEVHTV